MEVRFAFAVAQCSSPLHSCLRNLSISVGHPVAFTSIRRRLTLFWPHRAWQETRSFLDTGNQHETGHERKDFYQVSNSLEWCNETIWHSLPISAVTHAANVIGQKMLKALLPSLYAGHVLSNQHRLTEICTGTWAEDPKRQYWQLDWRRRKDKIPRRVERKYPTGYFVCQS